MKTGALLYQKAQKNKVCHCRECMRNFFLFISEAKVMYVILTVMYGARNQWDPLNCLVITLCDRGLGEKSS